MSSEVIEMHCDTVPTRLSVEEAADYTGLSISTLNKLRLTGSGPIFMKLNRRIVYQTSDLDSWLDSKRHRSTSEYSE